MTRFAFVVAAFWLYLAYASTGYVPHTGLPVTRRLAKS